MNLEVIAIYQDKNTEKISMFKLFLSSFFYLFGITGTRSGSTAFAEYAMTMQQHVRIAKAKKFISSAPRDVHLVKQ